MNNYRFFKLLALQAGLISLISLPAMAQAQTAPPAPAARTQARAPQPHGDPLQDDFAGLTYTDEQKKEIAKIRQDSAAHKAAVLKDDKLAPEQKDAMLVGYNRLEYGSLFKVLSPEQRRQVQMKIRARRRADQVAKQGMLSKPKQ